MLPIVLLSAAIGWLVNQLLKVSFAGNARAFLAPGGMPSSHSALTWAAAAAAGLQEGFGSSLFAIGFVLAVIVFHDAVYARKQHTICQAIVGALVGITSALAARVVLV